MAETAPVKSASIEKVLRLDDLVTCYVRRPEPASGRLEVGLEPASSETLASEAKARDGRRQARARRAAVTKRLEVGQRFRGVVLRRLAYGVSVDIGATGPGLVLRGDRDRDFVGVGDRVSVEVAAVEPRDEAATSDSRARREEEEGVAEPPRPAAPRRQAEPEPEPSSHVDVRRPDDPTIGRVWDLMSTKLIAIEIQVLFSAFFFENAASIDQSGAFHWFCNCIQVGLTSLHAAP